MSADNQQAIEEDYEHGSPLAMVCRCGLPMTRNPHPQAGTVSFQNDYGYAYECIPCLVQTRNRVGRSWRAAETKAADLRKALLCAYVAVYTMTPNKAADYIGGGSAEIARVLDGVTLEQALDEVQGR